MTLPDWLAVIERPFPSAVMVVIRGTRPIVVDPGSLTDVDLLPGLLADAGAPPEVVGTVVCSHYHADHVGAVAALQQHGVPVAAHAWEAAMINARDPGACASRWLDQPVLPYRVDRHLRDGDVVGSGDVDLEVVHTPGHTLGGISLWHPHSRTLICGDALHARDTPWLGDPQEGAGSLQRARLTLDRIETLEPAIAVSGHGQVIDDVPAAIDRMRTRLDRWAADPVLSVTHPAKRILVYRLMLEPIPSHRVAAVLLGAPWVRDLASTVDLDPAAFGTGLLETLAPVLETVDGALRTTAPHRVGPSPVPWHLTRIEDWPAGP